VKTLFILNEPAYGNERSYNALRLALSLSRPRARRSACS
jgi:sulfur relay (sulfurtransferase) complex TusBCD TusD component (DsrE family)